MTAGQTLAIKPTVSFTSTLILWGLVISAAAEIPEELRSTANAWSFLADMSRRCETHLQVYGYPGVHEEVCQDFEAQYTRLGSEFSEKRQAFEDAARVIDASPSYAVRVEWQFFMQRLQAPTDQVFKVMQHIIFLRQNELDRKKKSAPGKKK
jgi:hypothetical protein